MSSLPSPEFLALQQALVGRYSLIRELGRGGMGIVYLAQEVRLDRPVALKVLPPSAAADPALRERFLREARTAARLSHPHIVPIHAVHEIGEWVFFAMAFIEGETLGERVRGRGPLPPREATRILREVGWALAYAHAQGLVHRDVKPDNILLEAGSGRAVVTDFGIAHPIAAPADAVAAEVMGTAEFMSPEQVTGGQVDARSDLYGLGVVGFYLLSGRLPFQGSSTASTLAKQLAEPAPPLATVAPGLPLRLTQAVDRCLAKDPAQRFATGEELADALAVSLEERREVPAALRLLLKQHADSAGAMVAMEVFALGSLFVWMMVFLLGIMDPEIVPMLAPSIVLLALAATPVGMLRQMARRILRSGYDHADLVRAMRDEMEERRGMMESTYGSGRTRMDEWLKRLLWGGLAVNTAALGWMIFGPYFPGLGALLGILLPSSQLTWLAAGIGSAVRHQMRGHLPGKNWLRFWDSWVGRAIFRGAASGLETLPAGTPYGPTELAIGMAAGKLFEALPTIQREAFSDLPDVVRRLEVDAERMRASIRDLDALIADKGDPADGRTTPDPTAEGVTLLEQLKETRTAAEDRLRQVVAALETIRVELLRLHAGEASIASVTMDVGAARELVDDVGRMLAARREVERMLGRRTASGLTPLPTPG